MIASISPRGYGQVFALSLVGLASAAINNDASAFEIRFNDSSVGPDAADFELIGPWNYIVLADPDNSQYIAYLPSIAKSSLLVNASAGCSMVGSQCPQPDDQTWQSYSDWVDASGADTESYLMPASDWDEDYADLLNLTGAGNFFVDQVILHHDADYSSTAQLKNQGMAISKDYTVNLGTKQYTRNIGMFSLDGSSNNLTYGNSKDETVVANTTLQAAYDSGYIPSLSYGLHIGSVEPFVAGSFVLGGYDKSRILSDAIVAGNDNVFRLTDIALNVSSGSSAFVDTTSAYTNGLLKTTSDFGDYVEVHPRPGLPYLYLPKETCDAIAAFLPVTYSADYNLYLWDTADSAYEDIVTSPHYLSFVFSDDTKTSANINVPFALLNLTLDYPLASKPTQYFPCSPWEATRVGYTLGNAFLQAAFLSQHWQMNTTVLAQAPGPDYQDANVQAIPYDSDTTVGAATAAAVWSDTWSSTLKALSADKSSTTTSSSSTSSSTKTASTSSESQNNDKAPTPTPATLAGAIIGSLAGAALLGALLFFFLRRRRQAAAKSPQRLSSAGVSLQHYEDSPGSELEGNSPSHGENSYKPAYEVETRPLTELPAERQKNELPAQQRAYELSGDGPVIAEKPAGPGDWR